MSGDVTIRSALISVYHKENLDKIVEYLKQLGVEIYSTGGTKDFLEGLGAKVTAVEDLTSYPSILGGRVKTLHPKVFGGILARRDNKQDNEQLSQYKIPEIDLVIVDLYPFEQTLASGAAEQDIIEKIDIGGISLIRAAAKNFSDVVIVPSQAQYAEFITLLEEKKGTSSLEDRKRFAMHAFNVSSHYDTAIFNYFQGDQTEAFKRSMQNPSVLRYGENPHQKGVYYGDIDKMFDKINGKEISYNNLLDIDAAVMLINEFSETTVAILKHNNACGLASRPTLAEAWKDALAADSVSAFGGVIITNVNVDKASAEEIDKIFYEVIIAPGFDQEAIDIFLKKKNRIILKSKNIELQDKQYRSVLNGVLVQDRDKASEKAKDMKAVTNVAATPGQLSDLAFAVKLVKQSKSNTIVLAKDKQLIASGVGETSRVDALRHAIEKAKSFGFSLDGAVMASDAFFPFPDCVEIAYNVGVKAVVQPGGSINDQKSIDFCNKVGLAMVTTGVRHFKH